MRNVPKTFLGTIIFDKKKSSFQTCSGLIQSTFLYRPTNILVRRRSKSPSKKDIPLTPKSEGRRAFQIAHTRAIWIMRVAIITTIVMRGFFPSFFPSSVVSIFFLRPYYTKYALICQDKRLLL